MCHTILITRNLNTVKRKVLMSDVSCVSRSVVSNSLWPHGLYNSWNSPSQNTGAGSLSHLQGIFPTQGSDPGLPHCRWILYQLSPKGSPRLLEWVIYPFSSGSSWPRNWTLVSCIAGEFFTNWAVREAHIWCQDNSNPGGLGLVILLSVIREILRFLSCEYWTHGCVHHMKLNL